MRIDPNVHLVAELKIKFKGETQRYTVQAAGERFLICTKPFNARKTVLYTIVDLKEEIRGSEGVIFGLGAETKKDCQEMLARIESGETEISYYNRIPLDIEVIYAKYR